MKLSLLLAAAAAAALAFLSCGEDKVSKAKALLPDHPDPAHLASFPFGADSLLPAAGEIIRVVTPPAVVRPTAMALDTADTGLGYLSYDVVGVASAAYEIAGQPLRVEIAQFARPIDAYGYYAAFRPNGAATELIGRQSYRLGSTRYVYVGDYALTLAAADSSDAALAILDSTARRIADRVTVQASLTPYHILFPGHDRAAGSDRYFGYRFAGIPGMNSVYTMDYVIGTDTSRWFITPDSSGGKFLVFRDWAERGGESVDVPFVFKFDEGFSTYVIHPAHGRIIAGLVSGKLVGVLNYRPEKQEHKTVGWITGLK